MNTVFHEQIYLGDLLKYEEENRYSRDTITVAAGQNLKLGTVLGMLNGKAVALDPAATDGSEIAVGVLMTDVDATAGNTEAVMVSRNVLLSEPYVIWPIGLTTSQKITTVAELNRLGIILRIGA
jgi:hypothetical protein